MKLFVCALLFLLASVTNLQAQAPFYQGKTIRIIVGNLAGDAYDLRRAADGARPEPPRSGLRGRRLRGDHVYAVDRLRRRREVAFGAHGRNDRVRRSGAIAVRTGSPRRNEALPGARASRFLGLSDQPALRYQHRRDDQGEGEADRRRVPHLLVREGVRVQVEHDRVRASQRAAAGHDVRLDEELKAVDRRERDHEDRLWHQRRKRQVPETLPSRGALDRPFGAPALARRAKRKRARGRKPCWSRSA